MAYFVDPNYQTKARKPDDFDDFWADVVSQVERLDLDPEVVPDPLRTSDEIEVFQTYYTSIDNVRIAGWYCLPREREGAIARVAGRARLPERPRDTKGVGEKRVRRAGGGSEGKAALQLPVQSRLSGAADLWHYRPQHLLVQGLLRGCVEGGGLPAFAG